MRRQAFLHPGGTDLLVLLQVPGYSHCLPHGVRVGNHTIFCQSPGDFLKKPHFLARQNGQSQQFNLSSPQFCEGQCHLIQDISLGIARSHVVQQRCFGAYILNSTAQTSNLQFGIQRSNVCMSTLHANMHFALFFHPGKLLPGYPEIIAS